MINRRYQYQYQYPDQQKQQGSVLLIALVILLVMMIASIGLLRSVESGNAAAANISMGQNNQLIADWGVERGFEWLYTNRANLNNDSAGNGYYAIRTGGGAVLNDANWLDVANWAGANEFNSSTTPAPPAGYTVRVIINRMCANPGAVNAPGQSCSKGASSTGSASGSEIKIGAASYGVGSAAASGGSAGIGAAILNVPGNVYYRVMVRVEGPKNSLSVVQSMLTIAPT